MAIFSIGILYHQGLMMGEITPSSGESGAQRHCGHSKTIGVGQVLRQKDVGPIDGPAKKREAMGYEMGWYDGIMDLYHLLCIYILNSNI